MRKGRELVAAHLQLVASPSKHLSTRKVEFTRTSVPGAAGGGGANVEQSPGGRSGRRRGNREADRRMPGAAGGGGANAEQSRPGADAGARTA